MIHKTFHKVKGNPRYQLGYGCLSLLHMLLFDMIDLAIGL